MSELRQKRVEDQLQREISALILSGDIKDPRVNAFLSVTRVESARDYSHARVWISTFQEGEALEKGVAGLNSAAPYIQGIIGRKLGMRLTCKLSFEADPGIREGFEMTQRLKGL